MLSAAWFINFLSFILILLLGEGSRPSPLPSSMIEYVVLFADFADSVRRRLVNMLTNAYNFLSSGPSFRRPRAAGVLTTLYCQRQPAR